MKFFLGVLLSFAVGAGCRLLDIPVGSPPVVPGALLVLAMTLGYTSTNNLMNKRHQAALQIGLCGGPTGRSSRSSRSPGSPAAEDNTSGPEAS